MINFVTLDDVENLGDVEMNKEEAIELLMKEDIENCLKEIEENNFSISYWGNGWSDLLEVQKWFIDGQELIDFLSYYYDFNLHWSQWYLDLIEELKKLDYEIDE